MNNLLTFRVAVLQGKKVIVVGSKISQSELDAFQAICEREDRSMSYVLRELAVRGLAHYYADGLLKTTGAEDDLISQGRGSKIRNITADSIKDEVKKERVTKAKKAS